MTMPIRRLGGAISITMLSVALAGCGGSTPTATATPAAQVTASPSSEAPSAPVTPDTSPSASAAGGGGLATTGRIEVTDKGYALTLPDGWKRIDVSQTDLTAMMEAAGVADPALAAQYKGQIQAMLAAGLSFFALGPEGASNLNVLAIPGAGMSLDLLEQLNTGQIKAMAGGDVNVERLTLPAGESIHYRYAISGQGTGTGASIDQYLLLAGDTQLVVTATNASEAEATAIANSIELLD
jgi:hypothetical protein